MARCGCSGAAPCSCFIEAGSGVMVEGSGSPGSPYVISVDGNSTTIADTPTINMSITGSGTGGDPYVIFGSVKLDPSVDNVLAATANGLILTCDTIADCVGGVGVTTISDTSTVNMTLTGTGATGDPYIISAIVKLSATAGNLLTADGTGIYLSCAQIRGCLSAGDGLNYNSTTGVFEVQISTDVANTTVIGTDGGVYTPPGSGIVVDCGLEGVGTLGDPVIVNTGGTTWPFACDQDQGAPIYCSTDDGAIRADPEKFTIFHAATINDGSGSIDSFGATTGGALVNVGGPVSFDVDNPSNCRDMIIVVEAGVEHCRVDYNSGTNDLAIGAEFVAVGDVVANPIGIGHQRWKATGVFRFDTQRAAQRYVYTLPPGGSATFSLYSTLQVFAFGTGTLNDWRTFIDVVGYSV